MADTIQTSAILSAGMKLLRENLGVIETEIFLVTIKNKGFDYTEWRENLWEEMTVENLFSKAAEFEEQHLEFIPQNAKII